MPEVKVELKGIQSVAISSKVKGKTPRVVTSVRFEYEGEPSVMQDIL